MPTPIFVLFLPLGKTRCPPPTSFRVYPPRGLAPPPRLFLPSLHCSLLCAVPCPNFCIPIFETEQDPVLFVFFFFFFFFLLLPFRVASSLFEKTTLFFLLWKSIFSTLSEFFHQPSSVLSLEYALPPVGSFFLLPNQLFVPPPSFPPTFCPLFPPRTSSSLSFFIIYRNFLWFVALGLSFS